MLMGDKGQTYFKSETDNRPSNAEPGLGEIPPHCMYRLIQEVNPELAARMAELFRFVDPSSMKPTDISLADLLLEQPIDFVLNPQTGSYEMAPQPEPVQGAKTGIDSTNIGFY